MKSSEINVTVLTDEHRLPERIEWSAQDAGADQLNPCESMFMSIWDARSQSTFRIDLWTKSMTIDEMKLFYYQMLLSMSQTFERATGEEKMAGDMRDFCAYFAEKMGLEVKPPEL